MAFEWRNVLFRLVSRTECFWVELVNFALSWFAFLMTLKGTVKFHISFTTSCQGIEIIRKYRPDVDCRVLVVTSHLQLHSRHRGCELWWDVCWLYWSPQWHWRHCDTVCVTVTSRNRRGNAMHGFCWHWSVRNGNQIKSFSGIKCVKCFCCRWQPVVSTPSHSSCETERSVPSSERRGSLIPARHSCYKSPW